MDAAHALAREDAELEALRIGPALSSFLQGELPQRQERRKRATRLRNRLVKCGCILFIRHGSLAVEPPNLIPPSCLPQIAELRVELEGLTDEHD